MLYSGICLLYICEYYRYLLWVLKLSTYGLKYSSTKLKLRYMGKFRVSLKMPVLYMSIGPCNLSTKAKT